MTNRREFISLIASAAAYPVTALADQKRQPSVGVLTGNIETDPLAQARVGAFRSALAELGWGERDVRLVVRWPGPDIARQERDARELVAMGPDVILTTSTSATRAVRALPPPAIARSPHGDSPRGRRCWSRDRGRRPFSLEQRH